MLCDLRQLSALSGLWFPTAFDGRISKHPVNGVYIYTAAVVVIYGGCNQGERPLAWPGTWHSLGVLPLWALLGGRPSPARGGGWVVVEEERQELLSDGAPWWQQMLIAVSSGSPRIKEASCSGGGGGTGLARGWDHTGSSHPLGCVSPLPTWTTLSPWSDAFQEASHSRSPLPLPSPITPRTTSVVAA